jgi:hypothetical protein
VRAGEHVKKQFALNSEPILTKREEQDRGRFSVHQAFANTAAAMCRWHCVRETNGFARLRKAKGEAL